MTLEHQVHQHEMTILQLRDRVKQLESIVERLEKNSHEPIDFLDRICEAIRTGEIHITGITSGSHTRINRASRSNG